MVMDFIPGEDLATYFYKYIIEHDNRLRDVRHRMKNGERFNFGDIRDRVQVALGFERPHSQAGQATEFVFEEANMDKLVIALKNHNFKLDQRVLDKLRNTIRLLHENNIYHNDLHERNVVLKLDEAGQVIDVYIIDFDRALDIEDISVVGRDGDTFARYRTLVDNPEADHSRESEKWLLDAEHLKNRFASSKSEKMRSMWQDLESEIRKLLVLDSPNRLKLLADEIAIRSYGLVQSDDWCKLAGAIILDIDRLEKERAYATGRKKEKSLPPLARLLVQNLMGQRSSAYTQNFWRQLLSHLDSE